MSFYHSSLHLDTVIKRSVNTNNNWYSFVVLAAIGLFGALGQAAFFYNQLVHSYPYKMMDTPPYTFYRAIGEQGYYIAIVAAILGIAASFELKRVFAVVLPVVLCPLAYWVVFIAAHLVSGYTSEQMVVINFESATGYSNIYAFTSSSTVLLVGGIFVASLIGFSLLKIEAIWTRRAETRV